jgi:hypothetical protein
MEILIVIGAMVVVGLIMGAVAGLSQRGLYCLHHHNGDRRVDGLVPDSPFRIQ